MPIYEYRCDKCSSEFEILVWSARDEAKLKCPKCGHTGVQRVLSACVNRNRSAGLSAAPCGPSSGGFS